MCFTMSAQLTFVPPYVILFLIWHFAGPSKTPKAADGVSGLPSVPVIQLLPSPKCASLKFLLQNSSLWPWPVPKGYNEPPTCFLVGQTCQDLNAIPQHCPGCGSASMVSEAVWKQCLHTSSTTLNQIPSYLSCSLHCHLRVSSMCQHIFISLRKENFSVVCPLTACSLHMDLGNVPNK